MWMVVETFRSRKNKKQPQHVKQRQTNREIKWNQTSRWCSHQTTRRRSDVWFSEIYWDFLQVRGQSEECVLCCATCGGGNILSAARPQRPNSSSRSQTSPAAQPDLLWAATRPHRLTHSLSRHSVSQVNRLLPHTSLPQHPATLKPQQELSSHKAENKSHPGVWGRPEKLFGHWNKTNWTVFLITSKVL